MFHLAVEPSVLKTMENLPATTRTRVIQSFCTIMEDGLLVLNQQRLAWFSLTDFDISITRKNFDMDLRNGAVAQGFLKDHDGVPGIYIEKLSHVEKRRRISGKAYRFGDRDRERDTEKYIKLDNVWLAEQLQNPFVSKSFSEGFDFITNTPVTSPMLMEAWFYKDIEQIYISKEAERKYGFKPFHSDERAKDFCKRIKFDATFKNQINKISLHNFLEGFDNYNDVLVIVNFIDELDPLSLAQVEFINSVVFFLRAQYPDIKIQVVDVITRDIQGARPYFDEFLLYHKQHRLDLQNQNRILAPFTMVLGEVTPFLRGEQLQLPLPDRRRWFDIDLFADCRDKDSNRFMKGALYSVNLRCAAYNFVRAAGIMNSGNTRVQLQFRDLRGQVESEVREDITEILKTSAVVLINDELSSLSGQVANNVCCLAHGTGLPFIVILQTDFVEPGTITVPVNLDGSKAHVFAISKNEDETNGKILDALHDAHDQNPYLAGMYYNSFLMEG